MGALPRCVLMAIHTPSYITRNRLGIYLFQMKLPATLRCQITNNKVLFRKSLKTRSRNHALKHARFLAVIMDNLSKKYFNEPASFGKAMQLLASYDIASEKSYSFSEFEEMFLTELDEHEDYLLKQAIHMDSEAIANEQKLEDEIIFLKNVLLNNKASNDSAKDDDKNNPLLTDLMESWSEDAQSNMRKNSYQEYRRMVELFIKIIIYHNQESVPKVRELDADLIRKYKKTLKQIPKGVKIDNQSIPDLIASDGPKKSPVTIQNTQRNVGHFIKWIANQGYPIKENLYRFLTNHPRIKRTDKKKRVPFTDDDLKKLFNSEKYVKGLFKRSSDYWAPLISLFTGATVGEILQLHKSDITNMNNIHSFDFNVNDIGKTLKVVSDTKDRGRVRLVPIHPILIELGLLEFIESNLNKDKNVLFWMEEKNCNDKFGSFSKRFNRYKTKQGVKPSHDMELRDFHSFRHLVRTKLSNAEMRDGIIDDIVGHSSPSRSAVGENYNHANRSLLKNEAISKIKYDSINFSIIKNWKDCTFSK